MSLSEKGRQKRMCRHLDPLRCLWKVCKFTCRNLDKQKSLRWAKAASFIFHVWGNDQLPWKEDAITWYDIFYFALRVVMNWRCSWRHMRGPSLGLGLLNWTDVIFRVGGLELGVGEAERMWDAITFIANRVAEPNPEIQTVTWQFDQIGLIQNVALFWSL